MEFADDVSPVEEVTIDKKLEVDLYVAYNVPRSQAGRMRWQRGWHNAHVSLMVKPGVANIPDGISRSMVELLRQKMAEYHKCDPIDVCIVNIMRMAMEQAQMLVVEDEPGPVPEDDYPEDDEPGTIVGDGGEVALESD